MERVGKKAEALKRMLGSLELTAEVLSENFPFGPTKASFDLITLRWVKLDRSLLKKIVSRLKSDGLFIHYSSESLADEKIMAQTTLFEDAQAGITKGFTVYRQV